MKRILLTVAVALAANSAYALQEPDQSEFDHRIRYVDYNPDDVVQMETVVGIQTHIVTSPDESYVTHAFGDSQAYEFGQTGNHYFVKPIAEDAHTNLTIVTDKRSYNFRLRFRPDRRDAMYQLTFRYPEEARRLQMEAEERARVKEAFSHTSQAFNLAYSMSGDHDIAPVNAWDDGRFTYFKFGQHVDLPVIYTVDADGNENIVNRHMEGTNIIVMQKVAEKWIFRLGDRALAVWNDRYSERPEVFETGTVSKKVERTVQGGDQ